LTSNAVRTDAHRFYQHFGYTTGKTQYVFSRALAVADA
jgi:hypothetical protein